MRVGRRCVRTRSSRAGACTEPARPTSGPRVTGQSAACVLPSSNRQQRFSREASAVAIEPVPGAREAEDDIIVTRDGPVMTILFNRPQRRNAMTWAMYDRLHAACDEVDDDDSIRVLVLRGAGGKSFVAGTDISQFTAFETKEDGLEYERHGEKRSGRVEMVKKPVIGCIEGFAVGGGFAMAAGCDIRICTPESQFGLPIARTLGNCLNIGAYSRLVDLMGPSRAKEMIFM